MGGGCRPPESIVRLREQAELIVPAEAINFAIDQTSVRISVTLAEKNPLILGVLNGAIPYLGALLMRFAFPAQVDHLYVTRYGQATTGSTLQWHSQPKVPLAGRCVLFVDDVLDQGKTLAALVDWAHAEGAGEVLTTVLVDKHIAEREHRPVTADFAALSGPDRYLIGWGMDYQGYWRNLNGIYAIPDAVPNAETEQT